MRLDGRVAIVTGGTQGLGKTYALRLSEEGSKVVIADVLAAKGVQEEIEEKAGEALALHNDVSERKVQRKWPVGPYNVLEGSIS